MMRQTVANYANIVKKGIQCSTFIVNKAEQRGILIKWRVVDGIFVFINK